MKGMTIREIAELCGVDKTTVQRWAQKTVDAIRIEIDAKCRRALETKEEARFTLDETLAIIRAGGKGTLADLLEQNAKEATQAKARPALSGALIREARLAVERGLMAPADYRRLLGLPQDSAAPTPRGRPALPAPIEPALAFRAAAVGATLPETAVDKALRTAMAAAGQVIRKELDKAIGDQLQGRLL